VQGGSCPHRRVSADGDITCDKIALGDRDVSPDICHHCPARICDCQHLRFSLEKIALTPITVRWLSGRLEVWDDDPPRVLFLRSACEVKTIPVESPGDCLSCSQRKSWLPEAPRELALPETTFAPADNVLPFVRPVHKQRRRAQAPPA
jgi:hypothetical protein